MIEVTEQQSLLCPIHALVVKILAAEDVLTIDLLLFGHQEYANRHCLRPSGDIDSNIFKLKAFLCHPFQDQLGFDANEQKQRLLDPYPIQSAETLEAESSLLHHPNSATGFDIATSTTGAHDHERAAETHSPLAPSIFINLKIFSSRARVAGSAPTGQMTLCFSAGSVTSTTYPTTHLGL